MSRGPLPSKICLLSALPGQAKGAKVRFLGCVISYDVAGARLSLRQEVSKDRNVVAEVDISLILQSTSWEMLQIGAWVNVVGYITSTSSRQVPVVKRAAAKPASEAKAKPEFQALVQVYVQAILLWLSGPINIAQYEALVRED